MATPQSKARLFLSFDEQILSRTDFSERSECLERATTRLRAGFSRVCIQSPTRPSRPHSIRGGTSPIAVTRQALGRISQTTRPFSLKWIMCGSGFGTSMAT